MIVFSYGITKTGSTLAFELIKGCLESCGHSQERLADPFVEEGHPINFLAIRRHEPDEIQALIDHVPPDRIVAIKTHDSFARKHREVFQSACASGKITAQVIHRDPRDTVLSMLDAGRAARESGRQAFSEFVTMEDAKSAVERQLRNLDIWLTLPNVLEVEYRDIVQDPYRTIEQISDALKIDPDPDAAYEHAFHKAFTQKNKAKMDRFRDELSPADSNAIIERFEPYMMRHGYLD